MAKKAAAKKKAEKRERILGVAYEGTTKGNLLDELQDQKWHELEKLKECRVKEDDSIGWRLNILKEDGKSRRAERAFKLEFDDEKGVRLFFVKGGAKPAAASDNGSGRPAKKAVAKAVVAKKATTSGKPRVEDVPSEEED